MARYDSTPNSIHAQTFVAPGRGGWNGVSWVTEVRKWRGKSGVGGGKEEGRKGEREIVYAGGTRQSNFCTTTFSRFRERNLRMGKGGDTAENLHAREFSSVCWWRVSVKKKRKRRKKRMNSPS